MSDDPGALGGELRRAIWRASELATTLRNVAGRMTSVVEETRANGSPEEIRRSADELAGVVGQGLDLLLELRGLQGRLEALAAVAPAQGRARRGL
ncbi:MAG: hypothetical protein KIT84_26715 [Labilithrix sp.]|nr:hypothetical protein [Labilithrix sp.]MCW5814647.1 hypothetical protein [Labilithrix sp.]